MQRRLERCAEHRWELAQARPEADLAGDVVRYAGYREQSGWSIDQREVASPIVPLIIGFGDPFRVRLGSGDASEHRSFVAGLYDGYADVASLGSAHCMQVDFTPLGAHRFFGMPMRDLTGRTVALDLVGRFDELRERLFEAAGWTHRFALLDRFVRRRLGEAAPPSSRVAWAWRQLVRSSGCIKVGALADEVAWSRKHLAQRFSMEVGVAPKTLGRILRFAGTRKAIDTSVRARTQIDWAGLAADRGYADQAHLVREFHTLAGVAPTTYVRDAAGRFRALDGVPPR